MIMAAAHETGNYLNMKPRWERPRLSTTLRTKSQLRLNRLSVLTRFYFMFFKFGQINIWPSRKVIDTMPKSFKGRYKSTRVIIDCTEVRCQMPSRLHLNWELFSAYKNHTTLKGSVGISPSGAVAFRIQLYTGSISDREIVRRSGFLNLPFDDKDPIMADKGFID